MEQVYLAILKTFRENKQVFIDRHLPEIRQIDINIGQPDDPENFEVFCPAIFISWDIKPGNAGDPDSLTLDFHLLQEPKGHTESYSNVETVGIEYMRLINACKYLINKLRTVTTTPLRWAGERQAATPYFRYHIATYTCSIDADDSSIHRPTLTTAQFETLKITEAKQQQKPESTDISIEVY